MKSLLDWIRGTPTPKKRFQTRFVTIPLEEYELLKLATWNKGQRAKAQRKLKELSAWKINNGL